MKQDLRKSLEFFALRRSMFGILTMAVLIGMGEKMAERFLPVYLLALGSGEILVGALNGLDNLLSALYSFPGGYLAERLGSKRALFLFNCLAVLGFLIVILIPHWAAVFAGSVFFLSWTAISLPATMDIVAKSLPKTKRTMGVSMHSLVRRIPMALGPVVGGVFIVTWGEIAGVRAAFGCALVMAVVAMIFQQLFIEDDRKINIDKKEESSQLGFRGLWRAMTPSLRQLLVADILIRYCEQIPYAFIAIWCMKTISHPVDGVEFGTLTAIEMVTAMLVYIPVAYLADKSRKKPFVVMTFVFFTAFPAVLFFCHSFLWLIPAFVLRGLKEFGEPTRKALIMDLAPEGHKAGMFGLYYLVRDVVVSVSAFLSGFLWQQGPAVNFGTAFAFGLIGTLWFALKGKETESA
ncbi:MAG TPA: MFS transporter [Candidatus Hydrogenedentes bacterium]|nr:MFS transporter [Candidatus Hydrogenedentota bacterium]HOL76799.1 MFS transporter [Candidatus Hydrogenedentota bacterium]HPO85724.1 MFS transporter [Candidatus Hydrogenedentota bacterium]